MKEWWQDFFIPVTGEIMFKPRFVAAKFEVDQILAKTKLRRPAEILDLACGTGRHSLEFARRGFDVVGFDYSKPYLLEAKKAAQKEKSRIDFVHGDMKNLRTSFEKERFDLVVSLYNSFGYFKSRKDDLKMLREVYRVLIPGGKFVLNTLNGQGVEKAMQKPLSNGREPLPNVFMIDAARFDKEKYKTFSEWTIVDARKGKAKIHRMKFQQNVYTHQELTTLLKQVGFKIETSWGLLHGGPFKAKETWHQTIVARK